MDVETHKKDAEDSSNMDEEKASCFKQDKEVERLYTDGLLGNAVTHCNMLLKQKNNKQILRVQKLSYRARKTARAEEREAAEVEPRKYQKH